MPNITLSIPPDIYRRMRKHPEIKWSEVARKAIVEYLAKIEAEELSSDELLSLLGDEFRKELESTPVGEYEKALKETRDAEWKRLSTTPTS
ncbi:hypothetical protein [Thermococcus thioreducens]|uniref:CopG family transcriptional regulator n=1 Tax=Thermococcus thioreducens TaxID=277988 RepID=A0A0Q2MRG4_9EURY|nr:hypothetical protein [Thermococcus thioreducens]ASJ12826.1 hypothetical protein A3L14_07985 [Thermococcus thioreducens]KQH82295.1 hypothetical protein AMR53_06745 [Thermococcus thioreducens]SEV84684.1 hypothetical protein SAMN05216170_0348 [Thermococcus thioreducens]